jgi:hypothetical protein
LAADIGYIEFFKGHVNGKVQGFTKTDVTMFQAHPDKSKFFTEIWFHEMQFKEQGIIMIVNVQMHNLGLGSGYCNFGISISEPSGKIFLEENSIDPEQVFLDKEGFGITAGSNRVELKGNEYHIRYRGKAISGDFTYNIKTGSFQQGDGKVVFKQSGDYALYNFPIPWADITANVVYQGKNLKLKGVGSMNHDRQILSPFRYPSNWRAFWLYAPDATISIIRASSKDMAPRWSQRLMVAEPGKILFSSHDYQFQDLDIKPVPEKKVSCPRRFKVEAKNGDNWLRGEIRVTKIQEKQNILEKYPWVFRKLAELVVSETWVYRFWCDYTFELRLDGKTRIIRGTGTGNYISSVELQ